MEPTTENKIVLSTIADAGNEEPARGMAEESLENASQEYLSENSDFSIEGELADVEELGAWNASIRTRVALLEAKIDVISLAYPDNFFGDADSDKAFVELSERLIDEIQALLENTISMVEEMEFVDEKVGRAERIMEDLEGCTAITELETWIW